MLQGGGDQTGESGLLVLYVFDHHTMLFNSLAFLLFFVIVTFLFYSVPHRFRWLLLLLSSCYFYIYYIPVYIFIMAAIISIDYAAGIWLENIQDARHRRLFLILSLVANLGALGFFKYCDFFLDNLNAVMALFHLHNHVSHLNILLPMGLSFHTFQAMAYTIEIYRGKQKAERHLGFYALYIMFYPQLVAGPIERPQRLLRQFHTEQFYEHPRVMSGLRLMLWGLFKKLVVADLLAIFVDAVYNNPTGFQGWPLIWATLFFGFQIYCDFSGYSDIAIGAAKVMGYDLMQNFDFPYVSRSIREFWSRWHLSLSTWLRDYLFFPLVSWFSSRYRRPSYLLIPRDKLAYVGATFITFVLCGLWHGANWTFVAWGALHGAYLVLGGLTTRTRLDLFKGEGRLEKTLSFLLTFLLINFSWIFFRANSLSDAFYIVENIFHVSRSNLIGVLFFTRAGFLQCLAAVGVIVVLDMILRFRPDKRQDWSMPADIAYMTSLSLCIYLFGILESRSFIYFQF
jgi:D-alanyl-lipoteichoic acid acyltransferase DltB (MBOAT superfamily)